MLSFREKEQEFKRHWGKAAAKKVVGVAKTVAKTSDGTGMRHSAYSGAGMRKRRHVGVIEVEPDYGVVVAVSACVCVCFRVCLCAHVACLYLCRRWRRCVGVSVCVCARARLCPALSLCAR